MLGHARPTQARLDMTSGALLIEAHQGVRQIAAQAWQPLVAHESPFLDHAFLSLLEQTGCVGERTGWTPMILTASRPGPDPDQPPQLVGAMPMYLKTNSSGEFVFDWSWADAAHRAGLSYYPKGLVAVPFTPVTGRRVLLHPQALSDADERALVARALIQASLEIGLERLGLSSMHYNFILDEERPLFDALGLAPRYGVQYHWYNRQHASPDASPLASFDAFLARFRAKRRANIRRERRKLQDAGVTTRVLSGHELTEQDMRRMFRYYRSTVHKFHWGQQYLNEDLFLALPLACPDTLQVVFASQGGQDFAGALNMIKDQRLYGRYWGCDREVEFAHFEVCMYTPIAWCIERGVQVFEPGAGGEHKYERGFEPTFTYSAHALRDARLDAAVRRFLDHERAHLSAQLDELRDQSPLTH